MAEERHTCEMCEHTMASRFMDEVFDSNTLHSYWKCKSLQACIRRQELSRRLSGWIDKENKRYENLKGIF